MDLNRLFGRIMAPVLIAILAAHPLRADLIYFREGGRAHLPATTEGNRIVLSMPDGDIALPRDLIVKRVPGFWPESEWTARRQKAIDQGFAARYATVWWAIENGLTNEVTDELRKLHTLDPAHAPTSRMVAALDRLDQPLSDPNVAAFSKSLAIGMQLARGPHVILFHQHSDAEAEERIALLERVIRGYYLLFAAQGLELSLPRYRLMSAWFADENDYRAYLHSEHADVFATTRGYYHPTWSAVVAYDARSTDQQRTAREKLGVKRDELHRYAEMVDQAPAGTRVRIKVGGGPLRTVGRQEAKSMIDRLDGEVDCETLLLDLERRSIDLSTAAHEMIHQLASNTGLLPRHDAFPLWLHEGLAAQFEVIRGGPRGRNPLPRIIAARTLGSRPRPLPGIARSSSEAQCRLAQGRRAARQEPWMTGGSSGSIARIGAINSTAASLLSTTSSARSSASTRSGTSAARTPSERPSGVSSDTTRSPAAR